MTNINIKFDKLYKKEEELMLLFYICKFIFNYTVCTIQPLGIPDTPITFQVASLLLTNVPVLETPLTHLFVYKLLGVVVNKALI